MPFILAVTLLFVGCKKQDGFVPQEYLERLEAVPVISTAVNTTGSQAIDMLNLAGFQGKFDVKLYFPEAAAPSKVDIVVRKNNSNTNVKVYKAGVSTFPGTYTVTAAEIQALFGTPVVLNDNYDFGADIHVGDTKYEAFPVTGVGNSSGPINMIGYSEFARFSAICAYDPAIYKGNFVVVSDDFGELSPGDVVVLTQLTANSFSVTYPNAALTPQPALFPVTVDVNNNQASVTKVKVGDKFYTYNNPNFAVTKNTQSFVAPCDKTLTLNITYSVDEGSFGAWKLVIKKQ